MDWGDDPPRTGNERERQDRQTDRQKDGRTDRITIANMYYS